MIAEDINLRMGMTVKALHSALAVTSPQQAISIIGGFSVAELAPLEAAFVRHDKTQGRIWGSLRIALWKRLSLRDYDTAISLLDRFRPALNSPEFNQLINAETSSVICNGSAQLLFDGVNHFAERLELINNSRKAIDFQTFYFANDDAG